MGAELCVVTSRCRFGGPRWNFRARRNRLREGRWIYGDSGRDREIERLREERYVLRAVPANLIAAGSGRRSIPNRRKAELGEKPRAEIELVVDAAPSVGPVVGFEGCVDYLLHIGVPAAVDDGRELVLVARFRHVECQEELAQPLLSRCVSSGILGFVQAQ